MDISAVREFLKGRVELFQGFPEEGLERLVAGSRVATFEPNEALIEFGEEVGCLGVLLEGEAEASNVDDAGQARRAGLIHPGEVIGEMELMTGHKARANVVGITRCTVLLIPHALFTGLIITHPPAIRYLSRTISERLTAVLYDERASGFGPQSFRTSDDPYGMKLRTEEPVKLLVINCGSSSLKYDLFDTADEASHARGQVERIGQPCMVHTHGHGENQTQRELPSGGHREAFAAAVEALLAGPVPAIRSTKEITAVGHRVVHGGAAFTQSTVITEEVLRGIEGVSHLAPLHNPVNLLGIREAQRLFPGVPHVAVFDTAFHHTLPPYAYLYGLPYEYYEKGIRRYGFHGTSHLYVGLKAAEFLRRPFNELELVSCHLGNGASVCAIDHGRSVDTTMGLTPAEGLIMGTRSGSLDPAILVHLMRTENLGPDELDRLINKEGGLKGISGISSDMRELEQAAEQGHHRALLAVKSFSYQVRKAVGAYTAAMAGIDALIFTAGIGRGSAGMRSLICQGLGCLGVVIDEAKNQAAGRADAVCDISAPDAPVRVLVIPTDEERMIARETLRAIGSEYVTGVVRLKENISIPVEVSAHHVHLSQEHVEALFGPGHKLTPETELSQPGQFACREKVDLVGPKGRVERVRVLGPARKQSQVEIAMTEQFRLGIQPPVRESGDLENTPGVVLEGPAGSVTLSKGVICAMRHIHMAPDDAQNFGLHDKHMVRVRIDGARELVFGDVLVRVSLDYRLAMHIDTDEANAAGIATGATGRIEAVQTRN
jgi:acetate kinase